MEWIFDCKRQIENDTLNRDLLVLIKAGLFVAIWRARNFKLHNRISDIKRVVEDWELYVREHFIMLERRIRMGSETGEDMLTGRETRTPSWRAAREEITIPEVAEIKALVWATNYALVENWRRIAWKSDAQPVVNQVLTAEEPTIWKTRTDILKLRQKFQREDWNLIWSKRDSNRLANATAKLSVKLKITFCCLDLSSEFSHPMLRDICLTEELYALDQCACLLPFGVFGLLMQLMCS